MRALPLMVLLAVGCGKVPVTSEKTTGSRWDPVVIGATQAEVALAQTMCSALETKSSRLAARMGDQFRFNITETDCNGSVGSTNSVVTTLQNQAGQLVYMQNNGIVIQEKVETHQVGQLSAICSSLGTGLTNPIVVGSTAYKYVFTNGCQADTLCVTLETSYKATDGMYDIALKDRFAVDTSITINTGMIKGHQRERSGSCPESALRRYTTTDFLMVP